MTKTILLMRFCVVVMCVFGSKGRGRKYRSPIFLGDGLYWGLYRLEEDEPRAAALIEAAAKQGHEEALATIGTWYLYGTVVEADPKIAVTYLNKAHELGNLDAQMQLAFAYQEGKGVEQDDQYAYQLLRDAAEADHIQSMGFWAIICVLLLVLKKIWMRQLHGGIKQLNIMMILLSTL